MKKKKILSLFASPCILSSMGLLIASCTNGGQQKDITVNPIIDEETKNQFENIKSSCIVNEESTIEFICKQDTELDHNSIEIRVNGVRLKSDGNYKVLGNTITIFANAITSNILNVKANAKQSHVINTLKVSWVFKPLMENDGITSNDINVELLYKDGKTDILNWKTGYRIYSVEGDKKEELTEFDKKPFVFNKANYSYNFLIEYVADPSIYIDVKDIVVVKPCIEAFYSRYKEALEKFTQTKNKYGWVQFETNSKYKTKATSSAAIYYDENDNKAFANFKDESGTTIVDVDDFCIGGNTLNTIKKFIEKHSPLYTPTFTNNLRSFGFILKTLENTIEVEFDRYSYIQKFRYTASGQEYYGTDFVVTKYDNYVKTARVVSETYTDPHPILEIEITNTKLGNGYISNNDDCNKFSVSIKPRTTNPSVDLRMGILYLVDENNNKIYESGEVTLNTTSFNLENIEIKNWDNIKHNSILTLKFDTKKQLNVLLDEGSLTTSDFTFTIDNASEGGTQYIYHKGISQSNKITLKANGETEKNLDGALVLSYKDNDGEDMVLAYSQYKERSGTIFEEDLIFNEDAWDKVPLSKAITQTTLSLKQGRQTNFVLGNNLSDENKFGKVNFSKRVSESTIPQGITVSWEKPLTSESMFAVINSNGQNIFSQVLGPKTTQVNFDFPSEWFNKFKEGTGLTFEIKKDANFNIQKEKSKYHLYETQKSYTPIIRLIDVFKYEDHTGEESVDFKNIKLTISRWKAICEKVTGNNWKLSDTGHIARTSKDNFLEIELLVSTPYSNPCAGSEYSFTLTFEFETLNSYKKFVFNDFRIQFVSIPNTK